MAQIGRDMEHNGSHIRHEYLYVSQEWPDSYVTAKTGHGHLEARRRPCLDCVAIPCSGSSRNGTGAWRARVIYSFRSSHHRIFVHRTYQSDHTIRVRGPGAAGKPWGTQIGGGNGARWSLATLHLEAASKSQRVTTPHPALRLSTLSCAPSNQRQRWCAKRHRTVLLPHHATLFSTSACFAFALPLSDIRVRDHRLSFAELPLNLPFSSPLRALRHVM
jgi:hypothetical protein